MWFSLASSLSKRPVWRGRAIYELHVGTLTPEGTFLAAIETLDAIRDLGSGRMVRLMPVRTLAGGRSGAMMVCALRTPAHCYGRPDDLRALKVDAAHVRGLGVILDVVYNHLGQDGNYLAAYCEDYFSPHHRTP